ncbi:MAG TPA: alpha/beta hydrolase [Actinomycetes bacterium]
MSGSLLPTAVLVHGAFADASSWAGVTERLERAGVPVRAVVNPLRGVQADSAYVASVFQQIPGPVLAVGHSYGGVVITNAASMVDNVVGLVYVAAFVPEEGESLGEVVGSALMPAVVESKYPTGQGSQTASEFSIDPAKFHEVFAGDLSQQQSDVMAVSQRPAAAATLSEKSGPSAWNRLQSWAVVGTADKAMGPDLARSMARRAGADITEIDGSHVVMMSQPDAVTEVILRAHNAVS